MACGSRLLVLIAGHRVWPRHACGPERRATAHDGRAGRCRAASSCPRVALGMADLQRFRVAQARRPAGVSHRARRRGAGTGPRSPRAARRRSPPIRITSKPRGCSRSRSRRPAASGRDARAADHGGRRRLRQVGAGVARAAGAAAVSRDADRRGVAAARRGGSRSVSRRDRLARSLIVTAHGDLFAYDAETQALVRLTRSSAA